MRLVIQRVSQAQLSIDGSVYASIDRGLVVLIGILADDDSTDMEWITRKLIQLRIFPDEEGVMNRSLIDVRGDLLLVSQFTLYASVKKGNRPSYIRSAPPAVAEPLYDRYIEYVRSQYREGRVVTGQFGAEMSIALINEGPVTIIIDSRNRDL